MTANKQAPKGQKKRTGRPPRSGAFSILTKGIDGLPDKRRYIEPYLSGARNGWIRDYGPREEDMTTTQRVMVDRAVTFLGAIRLTEECFRENGLFLNPGGLLNPHLMEHYLAWNRALFKCLSLLGIDKRVGEQALDPFALARVVDLENGEVVSAKDGEIAPPSASQAQIPPDGGGA